MKPDPKSKTFETSLQALEEIVHTLEQGDLALEESLGLFEQGIRLARECQERLSQAERRIEVLLRDQQGRTTVTPFTGDKLSKEETETDTDDIPF
ncbi:MAG TPA: exodeoxyribonuclease VII small subunit [Pyrinomonadaceae bacterium]|jgi:exodeoxyribonuclease VII small subunit|nr:exodeoxyribonuclease VII small subunit [Pyrinomonadaceae bacterium]